MLLIVFICSKIRRGIKYMWRWCVLLQKYKRNSPYIT